MPATHAARSTTLDRPPSWGPRSDRTLHFHPPASNGAPHPVLPPHSAHYPQHLASLPSPQPRYSVQGQPPAPTYAAGHAATSYSHHHHHHHIAGAHQDAVGGMPVPPPSYSQVYTRLTSAPTSPQYARHRLPSSSNIEMKTAGATMASPGGSVSTSASPADPTSPSDRSEDMMRDSPSDRLGGSTGREVQRRQRNAEASARCRLKKRMKEKEDRHRYQEMEKQVQKLWSKLIIYETKNSEEAVKQLLEHRVPVDAMMPKLLTKVDRLIDENRYLRRKVGVDAERSAVS
ncbi:hypothetical protein H4R34_005445 [Dimargaris verticillata]|uniref:BZIP domain-containing protein n=1 Tax=Dimargaris verticillata TaxID=2761393 RepID=A0A9W8EB85_9FUNG|nr:hypothetical protein H4R34_005445 [Dimargaris verticillata]